MNKKMILSVGMPRAGTGWIHNITQILVIGSGGIQAREIRKKYHLGKFLTEVNCNIGTLNSYRIIPVLAPLILEPTYVIKLHAGRKPLADILISMGLIKPTFIYRDPRDAALSVYEYGQSAKDNPNMTNDFAKIRSVEEAIDYITPYTEIAREWISSKHTFVIKYEDLYSGFDEIIQEMVNFLDLGLQPNQALELVDKLRPGVHAAKRRFTHFKKGKIGRHQEQFSPAQMKMCLDRFGDFLKEQGYM